MILQALYDYYQRKADDPDPKRRLPRFGFEDKDIPFVIELTVEGKPLGITDTRQSIGKKKVARRYLVPKGLKKSVNIEANLFWGNAEYVLALPDKKKLEQKQREGKEKEYRIRLDKQHAAFRQRLLDLPEAVRSDVGIQAIDAFYAAGGAVLLDKEPAWTEILETNPNLTFRLYPDNDLVCQRLVVAAASASSEAEDGAEANQGICLVTGERLEIQRIHSSIKGVKGAKTTGADIVSFNERAYESYGKTKRQGENAPIGVVAAFAYTTALNHLLDYQTRQRFQVGDASTVFWAQKGGLAIEEGFGDVFNDPAEDDPDARTDRIRSLLGSVRSGQFDGGEGQDKFYVLGLAPNSARLSVRFWHASTVSEIGQRIRDWFDDLHIDRRLNDPEFPSLYRLLKDCAALRDVKNIPPNLGGDVMRAVLSGGAYPVSWLNAAIIRCRAEQEVSYLRAAAIKACFNRSKRNSDSSFIQEFSEMLDPANVNPAYLLGRLFSVLERVQEKAVNPKSTIRDRYYGAASSTPAAVFTTLFRLKNHHLSKLDEREAKYFERLIGEIMDGLADFPKHLVLQDQGRFALGYYHQRNYRKPESVVTQIESTEGESK